MISTKTALAMACFALSPLIFSVASTAEKDAGESKENLALKNRAASPKSTDIDAAITLDALLAKNEPGAFSTAKAASVSGHVVQVEKEEDGDVHMVLAGVKGETSTARWVIVEVTPSWQKKSSSLSERHLRALVGQRVRVTGWLYYEPDVEGPDPRGTRWEIHPVTSVESLGTNG